MSSSDNKTNQQISYVILLKDDTKKYPQIITGKCDNTELDNFIKILKSSLPSIIVNHSDIIPLNKEQPSDSTNCCIIS